jgi:molecular chaperone GrpE
MNEKEANMASPVKEYDPNLLPPADWDGEIDRLQDCLRLERDRTLRTLADFKNYRRRIERDGSKFAEAGKREIILPLLDIVDDLEKAMKWAVDSEQPFVKGVELVRLKFLSLLESQGVLPFDSVGRGFDPEFHEALATTNEGDQRPGTVVDELRRGYLLNNELLRHAQVRVSE